MIRDEFGVSLSTRMINLYRQILGFRWRRLRHAPFLSLKNKYDRFMWCQIHKDVDFSNHIFLDETMIRVFGVPFYHWRLKSSRPQPYSGLKKFRDKLNIWGGISSKGPTDFAVKKIHNKKFDLNLKNNI